ncbi:MAG: undecaprenyl-diphosphate phosphatase [Candidatus Velthaea sp.]
MQIVTFVQAMFLAILQGVSELFPVSSLGHTILIPALLRWPVDRSDESFLAFVVVLHLGTALALIVFYWREWRAIVAAVLGSIIRGRFSGERYEKVGWLLIAGTIPVGLLGVFFQSTVRSFFGSPIVAASFLIANAFVMFLGEWLRQRQLRNTRRGERPIEALSYPDGVKIGVSQALALLPGISRSGSSIVAGLLLDLDHEDAAKYSFLLATPVILAASVLEIPKLVEPGAHVVAVQAALGGVLAGVTAYASVAFLTRYFKHNDLRPFGWYCLIAGAGAILFFITKGVA